MEIIRGMIKKLIVHLEKFEQSYDKHIKLHKHIHTSCVNNMVFDYSLYNNTSWIMYLMNIDFRHNLNKLRVEYSSTPETCNTIWLDL